MRPIATVLMKEFAEIIRNHALLLSSAIPMIVFLFIPLLILARPPQNPRGLPPQLSELISRFSPELSGLPEATVMRVFLMRQFVLFLLMLPLVTALTISVHSIIGEKQNRSLEPLLATPISSVQLFVAKCLSAAIPSVALTWLSFALFTAGIYLLGGPAVFFNVMTSTTVAIIFVIGPLVSILGLSLGVMVSSRVNDPRSAQQIGALLILPLVGLFIAQMSGLYFLRLPLVIAAALVLGMIDVVTVGLGVALFDRETILVRWK
jgi:ABC-2 type transport system permease protein